jgi:EmrB/QacA subfamily drug resistance transporter
MKVSQKWSVAAVVLIGPVLALMDTTIVSVLLSQLQETFHTDFDTITWVASAYFLAEAAAIPAIGYLSDRLGTKRVYLTALGLFTVSSLLCALAPTKEALIVFRVLQGIGGGTLMPQAFAINYRIFPPNERSKLTAVISIPLLIAPAFAPTIGGYLSTSFNWNAVFFMNVPIGIVALLLCFLILPGSASDKSSAPSQSTQAETKKHFDIPGLLLSTLGVTTLIYGISQAGSKGWGEVTVLTPLLIGIAILIVFVVVELRVSDPVLDLRLFTNSTFTLANALLWLNVAVFYGGLFLLPLFFEQVQGHTALIAGQSLISQGLGLAVAMSISGMLYNRLGPRPLAVFGLLLLASGTYGLTQINANTSTLTLQVWLILRGLGVSFVYQPLQVLALSVVSNKGMAKASSLMSVASQVATATAVAALTTYLTQQTATHGVGQQAIAAGIADTFWIIVLLSAACIPFALVIGRDPAITALKQTQEAQTSEEAPQIKSRPNVISTLTANGKEIMGPEILVWRYPEDNIVNGSLLTVKSNHFCVLKFHDTIQNVYGTGQHIVQTPAHPPFETLQLTFSGEPMPLHHEVLYINRTKVVGKISGVTLSCEMVEIDYRVDYAIHVATYADAIQLVQHMPHRSHTLTIEEINAYAGPIVEQAVNQLLQATPFGQVDKRRQDLSQLVHQHLQEFLSSYGIPLGVVNVLVWPRDELMKVLVSLKAFGLSERDAVHYYTTMQMNATEHLLKERYDSMERNMYIAWRKTLERYVEKIAALQAELESTCADPYLPVSSPRYAHLSAHLQELSHAVSSDLQVSTPALWPPEAPPEPWHAGGTGQFKAISRGTVSKH